MKNENRGGQEQSQSRRIQRMETTDNTPLVSAKRGKFESLKDARIEALIYTRLIDYKAFVKELEGEEPEDGAIVSASLEMLFQADAGFERWRQERRKKNGRLTGGRGHDSEGAV